MTIAELIYALAKFGPDKEVVMAHNWQAPHISIWEDHIVALHIGEIEDTVIRVPPDNSGDMERGNLVAS